MASPIAALVVRVLADTSEIKENVKSIESTLTGMSGALGTVGKMVAAAFTVESIIAFGSKIIATADSLVKLHDKTGISLQGLQRFQVAGDDAGNTVEQLAAAVNMMQKRLVGDDKSAVAALNDMGLSLSELRRLAPDKQFMEIASAIRGVEDPAKQVALAMAVFGRNGAEVLPSIKRGFDDLKDASVGMSDAAVKALDDAGDAWDRLARKATAAAGSLLGTFIRQASGQEWMEHLIRQKNLAEAYHLTALELANLHAPQMQYMDGLKAISLSAEEQTEIERDLNNQLAEQSAQLKVLAKEQEAVATAMRTHWDGVGAILDDVFGVEALTAAANWMDAIDALGGSVAALSNDVKARLNQAMLEALDVMARNGTLTEELSSKYAALLVATTPVAPAVEAVARALDTSTMAQDAANAATARVPELMTAAAAAVEFYNFTLARSAVAQSDLLRPQSNLRPDTQSQIAAGLPLGTASHLTSYAAIEGSSAGMPHYAMGGPTSEGMAYLHNDEYVVPKGGALVRGGGGGVNITINGSVLSSKEALASAIKDALESVARGSAVRIGVGV